MIGAGAWVLYYKLAHDELKSRFSHDISPHVQGLVMITFIISTRYLCVLLLEAIVKQICSNHEICVPFEHVFSLKTKFLNGKISFIKRYLPHYNLCYMPLPLFQK